MLADGEHFLSVSNLISARNDHQRHEHGHVPILLLLQGAC